MKVLHLFSDWKWTGPAEPVVSLCEALQSRGVDAVLAHRRAPADFPERTVGKAVAGRGVNGYEGFKLNRYFSVHDWFHDVAAIRRYAAEHRVDLVHTHLSHDHVTAVVSYLFAKNAIPVIRTDHKRDGMPGNAWMARVMARTDGLVTYSRKILAHDVEAFAFPGERATVIPPAVKGYEGPLEDVRGKFGIGPQEKVIGVIGRLKPDRGYDVILKAFKRLRERMDGVKLLIMGRSSQIESSILRPLAELGLDKDVILAGYHIDDYFSVIACFDLFLLMRAGSDGTARALREVLSMGKPAIVSSLGMLPELVSDGETGFVVDLDEGQLADRMERVLSDDAFRERLGANAKAVARGWDYATQADTLILFYEKMCRLGRR